RRLRMSDPHLRIRASGYGGSGYFNPFTGEKVIGVTTALGAIDAPGIRSWVAEQTAAYAVANVDMLLERDEERGFAALRWYHNRMTPKKYDDPEIDIENYHVGVLNDLAELGTLTHEWIEAYVQDLFPPDLVRDEQYAMVDSFVEWWDDQDVEIHAVEATLFGGTGQMAYGGTADLFVNLNGKNMLIDVKTSRAVYDSHVAQLAAYGAADTYAKEVPEGTEGAVEYKKKWFVAEPLPPVEAYGVLRVRPDDWTDTGEFIPSFCELQVIPHNQISGGYQMFQGAVQVRQGQREYKQAVKEGEG
ncbi:MAG TPA: hypothetical protein VK054_07865, partial [Beutenbergiaceae bacterium]|nr:hypothetical protein [Beutenbergiaceae bacterium]